MSPQALSCCLLSHGSCNTSAETKIKQIWCLLILWVALWTGEHQNQMRTSVMSRGLFSVSFFFFSFFPSPSVSRVSAHGVFSALKVSHITAAGSKPGFACVPYLRATLYFQGGPVHIQPRSGTRALLTRAAHCYCDRYGTQKEFEWAVEKWCFRKTFISRNLTTGSAFSRQKIPVTEGGWLCWIVFFSSLSVSELVCFILIKSKSFETRRNNLQFCSSE